MKLLLPLYCFQLFVASGLALVARNPKPNKEDFLVKDLPGLHSNIPEGEVPLMYSGQIELYSETDTHYYFWKYIDQNKVPIAENKTIFWLNGGPGCSSMDGALMEAGPFRINDKGEVTYNEGSWHKAADVIFVDQPAGTGFSYSDSYDVDLNRVVEHFLRFLDKYFEYFPEDLENDIYIAGESYAGQYIPFIGRGILDRNQQTAKDSQKLNLKGLLIGNGWIAPNEQSLSYLPFSHQAGIIDESNPQWQRILHQHELCQKVVNDIKGGTLQEGVDVNQVVSNTCEKVLNLILEVTADRNAPKYEVCYNMYDYTLKDSFPSCGMNWPPDLANVKPFLNTANVMDSLHVESHREWHECDSKVGGKLKNRHIDPAVTLLPSILEEIPVVLFNGNRDIICNYMGTEDFVKNMKWNGETGFGEEENPQDKYLSSKLASKWVYDDEEVGYVKSARNLTFVNIFDASHMVPFDKPFVSRSVIDLILGEFDEDVSDDGRSSIITYPLGTKSDKIVEPVDEAGEDAESEVRPSPSSPSSSPTESASPEAESVSSTTSRITRLIQLLVICILIWGVYILYTSYKARPSSIIKSKSSPAGKKKNVQWADQLRQFQEDDEGAFGDAPRDNKSGFLSKAYNKLTGAHDVNGIYAPAPSNDIEMGIVDSADPSNFEIHSDDEEASGQGEREEVEGEGSEQNKKKDLTSDII